MSDKRMKQEMQEAVQAGERALRSLYAAKEKLQSARNWGFLDIMGGGMFSDMMKHSKIRDASRLMEQAKHDLRVFQKELKDVSEHVELHMEIGGFLSFADFFFDGIVADYLVQSRIANAREQVENAIRQIEHIVNGIKQQMNGEV